MLMPNGFGGFILFADKDNDKFDIIRKLRFLQSALHIYGGRNVKSGTKEVKVNF